MRIDAYTHFIPEKFFNKIVESGHADIGKRVREIPCIHDLDVRRKIVDGFKDYLYEKKSKYEIWWTFGWSYETAAAMARLVFSKIMDKYPNLKIITHHFGGIVPMLEGRIGPGWDQLGARTSDEDLSVILKQ